MIWFPESSHHFNSDDEHPLTAIDVLCPRGEISITLAGIDENLTEVISSLVGEGDEQLACGNGTTHPAAEAQPLPPFDDRNAAFSELHARPAL